MEACTSRVGRLTGYSPLYVKGFETGLVQQRQEFILPDDAYPVLQNAYVWREQLRRKQAYQLLGRLTRTFDDLSIGNSGSSPWTFNILNVTGFILTANNANPGQVTTRYGHNLQTGDLVTISGVVGSTGYNSTFTITVLDSLNFTIGTSATGFGTYVSGGIFYSNRSLMATEPNATIQPGSLLVTINPSSTTGSITGYNNTTNCEVFTSAPHGLSTGNSISISGVMTVPDSGIDAINGGPYVISVVSPTSFTINRNSLSWSTYASGGTWTRIIAIGQQLQDQGNGTLVTSPASSTTGTINYVTGNVTITNGSVGVNVVIDFGYYPNLPVMGIRIREINGQVKDPTVFFDTIYAYVYNNGFQEFLPGTTWSGTNSDFFWTTNYWNDIGLNKIFWTTNYSLTDPIRYTNGQGGTNWVDFAPIINAAGDSLFQTLAMIPFRGRLLAFNTSEGASFPGTRYTNRIRWAAIGTPFTVVGSISVQPNINAWRDDIRGQGGFLDIPTNEDIISIGFVRDNLVIYCEQSTWQLRYTGRTIAPFQIEKVNSELGSTSTFSSIQFDTSLMGIGDKGIVECDSFKSERIDIKIPDFVWNIQKANNGQKRIQGIRDFFNRLAYWTYVSESEDGVFPDRRLVYNYENDSWAIFTDSLTTLGTFNVPSSRTWINTHLPWIQCNFPWINQPLGDPVIVGGNQQGFIEQLDETTTNDPSLYISAITANTTTPTVITSPSHNMQTGFVIKISSIPNGTPFDNLNTGINPSTNMPYNNNNGVFGIIVIDSDNFQLMIYDPSTGQFSTPQLDTTTGYVGSGLISVRDNFIIQSKKFNFLDEGESIQLGYIDLLMDATEPDSGGAISLNVYLDYNDSSSSNTLPQNVISDDTTNTIPDTFFNSIIPTTSPPLNKVGGNKFVQRVFCATRATFLTIQYTFNNAQMAGIEQELDVQIDNQILWIRKAGRINPM